MRKLVITLTIAVTIITIVSPSVSGLDDNRPVIYEINQTYTLNSSSSDTIEDLEFQFYLLDNWEGWAKQEIISENISTTRGTISITSTSENRYAVVNISKLDGETETTISAKQVVKVSSVDLNIQPEEVEGPIPEELEEKYTVPVDYLWESDNPDIKAKARELTSDENNYYYKARRILEWVENHLTYELQTTEHSALWAFERDEGDCTEYSNLFIALARASGIPAKTVSGYLPFANLYRAENNDFEADLYKAGHQWVVIYLPSVGWTPVDLTYNIPDGQFGEFSNDHITELVSNGSNWVHDEDIRIPSYEYSGSCYSQTGGGSCGFNVERTAPVRREVSVRSFMAQSFLDKPVENGENDLRYTVVVKNAGSQNITNVRVRLKMDNRFSPSSSEKILNNIGSNKEDQVYFDVGVTENVENIQGTAIISYDAGKYGSFVTRKKTPPVTVLFSPEPSLDIQKLPLPLEELAIISIILIGITAGIIFLSRR